MSAASWWELWGRIGGMIALVVGVVTVLNCWIKLAYWRRTLWQLAVLSSLVLVAGETIGVSRALTAWVKAVPPPAPRENVTVSVSVLSSPPTDRQSAAVDPAEVSAPAEPMASPPEVGVWWPAKVWLAGFGLVLAWQVAASVASVAGRRRMRRVTDAGVLERVHRLAQQLRIRRRVSVRESSRLSGPIAFGVLRPTIALPDTFGAQFTTAQQEAMLAHELAHLGAGDPGWHRLTDTVTAILWWHPLAWWARRQLRAASEMAADEASLVVDNGSSALAESLVVLGRRLSEVSWPGRLGLDGTEFRSGLGRRVERLLRMSGERWRAISRCHACLIRGAGMLALVAMGLTGMAWTQPRAAEPADWTDTWSQSVACMALAALQQATDRSVAGEIQPKDTGAPGREAVTGSETNQPERARESLLLPATNAAAVLVQEGRSLYETGHYDAAADRLRLALQQDPHNRSAVYYLDLVMEKKYRAGNIQRESPGLRTGEARTNNLDLLDAIVKGAEKPIKFSVEDHAVEFSPETAEEPRLYNRFFRVDQNTFLQGLRRMMESKAEGTTGETNNLIPLTKKFLAGLGVDLSPPKGLFFNDRFGIFQVRATLRDLETIEQTFSLLNMAPPQVTIEVKLCEVTSDDGRAWGIDHPFEGMLTNQMHPAPQPGSTNAALATTTAILTEPQFRAILKAMEQRPGVDILIAPKITTLSGRQAKLKVAEVKYVVTDLMVDQRTNRVEDAREGNVTSALQPVAEPIELGPVIDVVPYVMADGRSVQMNIIASIKEFVGYDFKEGFMATVRNGPTEQAEIATPLPRFRVRQVMANTRVRDGHTAVLYGGSVTEQVTIKDKVPVLGNPPAAGRVSGSERTVLRKKNLLVFVTPTLIDPAGNRIHPAEELPFPSNSVPGQSPPASRN